MRRLIRSASQNTRRQPSSTLFPYTTLFRSQRRRWSRRANVDDRDAGDDERRTGQRRSEERRVGKECRSRWSPRSEKNRVGKECRTSWTEDEESKWDGAHRERWRSPGTRPQQ